MCIGLPLCFLMCIWLPLCCRVCEWVHAAPRRMLGSLDKHIGTCLTVLLSCCISLAQSQCKGENMWRNMAPNAHFCTVTHTSGAFFITGFLLIIFFLGTMKKPFCKWYKNCSLRTSATYSAGPCGRRTAGIFRANTMAGVDSGVRDPFLRRRHPQWPLDHHSRTLCHGVRNFTANKHKTNINY